MRLADHVLNLHMNNPSQRNAEIEQEEKEGEIELNLLRKYIGYARARVHPRLTEKSAVKIQDLYVKDREIS